MNYDLCKKCGPMGLMCASCIEQMDKIEERKKQMNKFNPDHRWRNTCEYKHLESECLGCAEYDEYDNLIDLRNYKKEESNGSE